MPSDFHDASIPSFIGLHVRVASTLERHWWDVARYHVEFLGDADLMALTHQMSKVGAKANVPMGVLKVLQKLPKKESISRDNHSTILGSTTCARSGGRQSDAVVAVRDGRYG